MLDRDKPCYLTPTGKRQLELELEDLRTVRRPAIAENMRQLNGFGGSSENSEIDDFINEQTQLEAHIKDLEYVLRHAILIEDGAPGGDKIRLGSRVTVRDSGGEEIIWTIVGSAEANRRQGKISSDSLVGASLLGHGAGEMVTVQAPAGPQEFTILKVE